MEYQSITLKICARKLKLNLNRINFFYIVKKL
jgi:hypothetical protein